MAETHLRTGHDVVMPQLATRVEEIEGFQATAERAGAEYHEIARLPNQVAVLHRRILEQLQRKRGYCPST